jgi:thiamine-monophosphate kinase
MKIKDIGEFGLIDKITKKPKNKDIVIGIGDDAAVIKQQKGLQVLTTDCLVEGDHFRREWFSSKQIGMKAIEINVSDVAAMGGQPKYVLVSLTLPENIDVDFVEDLYSGMWKVCDKYNIEIIGGNMSHCEKIVISITLTGIVNKNKLGLRNKAKPGDFIFVSNHLGCGHAGLRLFQNKINGFKKVKMKYLEPKAQLDFALKFASYINAMIDVSDGLAPEIRHICNKSNCGAIIYRENIPIDNDVRIIAKLLNENEYDYALYGGEDFALVYTVSKDNLNKINGYLVGEITEDKNIFIRQNNRLKRLTKSGYDHFNKPFSSNKIPTSD